jgi:hypothetical protein
MSPGAVWLFIGELLLLELDHSILGCENWL